MPLTRRSFLEVSALSATGFACRNMAAPLAALSGELEAHDSPQSRPQTYALAARLEFSLDQDWQFFRPDENPHSASVDTNPADALTGPKIVAWEQATLPHAVRLEPRDVSGGRNYRGACWYRKRLPLKAEWKGRVLYINFEGAMQVADVWLNGIHLTTHYGGYIPFTVDISKVARFDQEDLLIVRLDNSDNPEVPPGKPQDTLDFVYFGGLYRSVQLQVCHPLHITHPMLADKVAGGGVFVTYPKIDKSEAVVSIQTDIANESIERRRCQVTQDLLDQKGNIVASSKMELEIAPNASRAVTQTLQVRGPELWHPNHPNLYLLHTTIREGNEIRDDQYCHIGLRTIQFDHERGLLINGEAFLSIGANRHQDHPYVGCALPASAHYRDAYKLREAGFTSYRSHYPQDPSFMDACDELGILAIVSNPGWQFVGDDLFARRVYQDAREMMRRDRNRPSVILWEAALNESDNRTLAVDLYRIVHEEYPGPSCYASGDPIHKPVEGFHGWDVEYGEFKGYEKGYEQKSELKPWWIREWGDQVDNWSDQQGRVRVARGWGETPMLVQAAAHLHSLDSIYSHGDRPAGADLWAGIDAYRGYHHQPFLGAPLDVFRLPKFDYFLFQSQRPPKLSQTGGGPMVFIANFATFQSPSNVTVFSNCEQVRLFQNGKELASQPPDPGYRVPHPPFTFKVDDFSRATTMLFASSIAPSGTEIGELRAEGLINGTVAATHIVHSPGVPASIRLRPDMCGRKPVADGADWVRVYAHICDSRGTTHPYADDVVTFSVSGEGSLIGGASIFANPSRAEAGISTALVCTNKVPGLVTVRASAPGLEEGTIQFESEPSPTPMLTGTW
jgi:beta-galactosidase